MSLQLEVSSFSWSYSCVFTATDAHIKYALCVCVCTDTAQLNLFRKITNLGQLLIFNSCKNFLNSKCSPH